MELVRWRWRAVTGVLLLAALLFWAMVTFLGGPSTPSPATLASAANNSQQLPSFPLEFPDVSQPLQESVQELGTEPVPGSVVEDNPVVAAGTKKAPTKVAAPAKPTTAPAGSATSGDVTVRDPDAESSSDSSEDPVEDVDTGFENPSTFGPDEPEEEEIPEPEDEPDPEPAPLVNKIRGDSRSGDGANGSSQAATDEGASDSGNGD